MATIFLSGSTSFSLGARATCCSDRSRRSKYLRVARTDDREGFFMKSLAGTGSRKCCTRREPAVVRKKQERGKRQRRRPLESSFIASRNNPGGRGRVRRHFLRRTVLPSSVVLGHACGYAGIDVRKTLAVLPLTLSPREAAGVSDHLARVIREIPQCPREAKNTCKSNRRETPRLFFSAGFVHSRCACEIVSRPTQARRRFANVEKQPKYHVHSEKKDSLRRQILSFRVSSGDKELCHYYILVYVRNASFDEMRCRV